MNKFFFIILLLFSSILNAQNVSGTIRDSISNETLPYVNITLLNENIGTSTDEKGHYSINLDNHYKDTLLISYIGYKNEFFPVKKFIKNQEYQNDILLNEKKEYIDEVIIKVKKAKYSSSKSLGVDKSFRKFGTSVQFGFENCVLIKNNKETVGKLEQIKIRLSENEMTEYKNYKTYYRLKFYEYDNITKSPGKLLSYYPLLIKPKGNKNETLKIDLTNYNILFPKNGICIGIETINPNPENKISKYHTTFPNIYWTYSDESLTWISFRGKEWKKRDQKFSVNTLFGKEEKRYVNPLIEVKVKYRKK